MIAGVTVFILLVWDFGSATPHHVQKRRINDEGILPGADCLDYTINRCDFGHPDVTTFGENIELCSFACTSEIDCKFFVYNYKKRTCDQYFIQENSSFRTYCDELAGPNGTIQIDQCTDSPSDPCKGIRKGYCQYDGLDIKTYEEITTELTCQKLCSYSVDCKSYIYTKSKEECKLLDSDEKTCDEVIVEKDADVAKCRAGCPTSEWNVVNDECYLLSPTKMPYSQAFQFCKQKGGWLAEIKSSNEQAALGSLLQTNINYWIGLTDTAVKGKWVWQHSNQAVGSWTNWGPNLPDDYHNSNERCAETFFSGKWMWNDLNCANVNSGAGPVPGKFHDVHALCQFQQEIPFPPVSLA